ILNEQNQLITSSSSSILTKLSTTHQACSCLFYYCKSKKHLLFSRIYLFSKLQSKNSILSSSSSSSSSFDLDYSQPKRQKLSEKLSSTQPQTKLIDNKCQSLFDNYGPNRYIISLIITEKTNKKFILLNKNKFDKWELPKTKKLKKKNIHYHTLDVCYLDHPLNTDDAWTEVEIILISKNPFKFFHGNKTWFSMKYLDKLNNIEKFDFDLIEFYT
ncbi:unnamed protein product, partial [Rotaria socialis]